MSVLMLGDDEWKKATRLMQNPLEPYFRNADMGAIRWENQHRMVTVKHRMRRDRVAVATMICWNLPDDYSENDAALPGKLWIKTASMLKGDAAAEAGQQFLDYLETGKLPTLQLETYPGYEDLDNR